MPIPKKTIRARELRRDATPFEIQLWQMLRSHKMEGIHWRRQHPIGPYFADFACATAKLIVELDGNSHDGREAEDANRDATLLEWGWTTLRIPNRDLMRDPESVWRTIAIHLESPTNELMPKIES
ncbi:DUF559 domain-containing protein [bacterium]|nr:MAG: DUF559 domain-containing protein [bacterium]